MKEDDGEAPSSPDPFRSMSELSTDFVGMASPDGKAIYLNPSGRALCGIGIDEDISQMFIPDFHPENLAPRLKEALAHATTHGTWRGPTELLARDGTVIPGNQLLICHRDASGRVERFSTVIRDKREIVDLEHRLARAQRLEAIGRLAGGVAHDFNNLLTVIDNCAVMVGEELPTESPGRRDVSMILEATDRAVALCRQLLSFARRQIIHPVPTRLNQAIVDVTGLLSRLIGEHIQLELELTPDAGYVLVDPSQLDQVLANLVVNAREAMPDGGVLIVSTQNVTLDAPQITEEDEVPAGEYVKLTVADTGVGMSPDVRSRIFEPFYSNRRSGGSGLGLATVYGAISQNHGHISVESALGKGTQFQILLPRIAAPKAATQTEPSLTSLEGTESILLVEDEEMVRKITARMLKRAGYQVADVGSPAVALKLASQTKTPFDLVLTDVVMPDMNGPALVERLRELWGPIRVLFASGYTQNALDEGGILHEEICFLSKPFTERKLLEAVRRTLSAPPMPDSPDD